IFGERNFGARPCNDNDPCAQGFFCNVNGLCQANGNEGEGEGGNDVGTGEGEGAEGEGQVGEGEGAEGEGGEGEGAGGSGVLVPGVGAVLQGAVLLGTGGAALQAFVGDDVVIQSDDDLLLADQFPRNTIVDQDGLSIVVVEVASLSVSRTTTLSVF